MESYVNPLFVDSRKRNTKHTKVQYLVTINTPFESYIIFSLQNINMTKNVLNLNKKIK